MLKGDPAKPLYYRVRIAAVGGGPLYAAGDFFAKGWLG